MSDLLAGYLDVPLVNFKLDKASNNVVLDQDQLLKVIQRLRDWIKDVTSKGFDQLRDEIDTQVTTAKHDVSVAMADSIEALEGRCAPKAAVVDLSEAAAAASERSVQVESKQGKLFERVNLALEKTDMVEHTIQSLARQIESGEIQDLSLSFAPSSGDVRFGGGGADRNVGSAGGAGGADRSLGSAGGVGIGDRSVGSAGGGSGERLQTAERRGTGRSQGASQPRAVLGNSGLGNEVAANKEKMELLNIRVTETKDKLELLDERVDVNVEKLRDRLERCETATRVQSKDGQVQAERLEHIEVGVQKLEGETVELVKELRVEKANVEEVTALGEKMGVLQEKLEQACMTESLELRVAGAEQRAGALERRAAQLERDSKDLHGGAEAAQHRIVEIDERITSCDSQAAKALAEVEARLNRRCMVLEQEDRKIAQRLDTAEAMLTSHSRLIAGMSDKASSAEVSALKAAMVSIAEDVKDREQAVLFGARCLSCNRVFDDCTPEAGVVNVQAEKQKAQVFADLQRALHNPGTDPTQPIKMLAVKVGRPGGLPSVSSRLGTFEGRDPASLAWTAEDVSIVPVRSDRGRQYTPAPPASARPSSSVVEASGSAGAEVRRASEKPRASLGGGGAGNASLASLQRSPRGKMDFKHPLSNLVGRG